MKLLFLVDNLEVSTLDGPALWLADVAARWAANGHRVEMLCLHAADPRSPPADPPGVTVHRPEPGDFESTLGRCLGRHPDVLHVASAGPFGARAVEILRELPVLLDVHDFWPVCPARDLLRRPELRPCGEHFPFLGCEACAGVPLLRAMAERQRLVAGASVVVAHSVFARVRLEAGLGRAVEMIDYGTDTQRFRPDPAPPRSPEIAALYGSRGRPRGIFLGPPTHSAGADRLIDILVAATARVPDLELVVAGCDVRNPGWDEVARIEARELGLADHLRILPAVPPEDLPALYASCQVAIVPALGNEAAGLFVLQALASGLPVVASPVGALRELVRQGEEGLMLPGHDPAAFANGICALILDPNARQAFAESARLAAVERHDIQRSVFQLEELYRRLGEFGRAAAA